MELFEKDSIQDLVCRGIPRVEICSICGVDEKTVTSVTYRDTKGIDRKSYQHLYIATYLGRDGFLKILGDYNGGNLDRPGLFRACGLGPTVNMSKTYQTVRAICEYFGVAVNRGSVKSAVVLFQEDSAEDLICRCYPRDEIFDKTGVDSKGINRLVQLDLRCVDKKAYQHLHVRTRVGVDRVRQALLDYGDGRIDKSGFFAVCGIGEKASRAKVFQSIQAICECVGLQDEYAEAYVKVRASAIDKMQTAVHVTYGVDSTAHIPGIAERRKATFREKYGCDYPLQNPAIRAKAAETMIERHGHAYSLQCDDIRALFEATMLDKYKVRYTLESDVLREKATATFKAHSGYDHPFKDPRVIEKGRVTMMAEYGTSIPMHSDVIKARVVATNRDKYGVDCVFASPRIRQMIVDTNLRKYGVDCFLKTAEFREKCRATSLKKYGVDHPNKSPAVQAHVREGMRRNLGVDYSWQNPDVYAKFQATMLSTYGETRTMRVGSIRDKVGETKTKNGTWASSEPEETLYTRLVERFGESDVVRQYDGDPRYKHHCDFYIKSRQLFIELNGNWSHFGHWFGSWPLDVVIVDNWRNKGTENYLGAVRAWTVSDVRKRGDARAGNLNYVVFWAEDGSDMDLWFAMGCPDGHDWEHEYSWLPGREISCDMAWPDALSLDWNAIHDVVRRLHWYEYYSRELAFWSECFDSKWGTRQVRLYTNRLRVENKRPDQLTSQDIVDGLNVSGTIPAHAVFDNSGLIEFLSDYKPKLVYDPMSGWGESLLTCMLSGVESFGASVVDVGLHRRWIDAKYEHFCSLYGLDGLGFGIVPGCGTDLNLTGGQHDAVFTWLSREFLRGCDDVEGWFRRVVAKSVGRNTHVFAYQVGKQMCDSLENVMSSFGWRQDKKIAVRYGRSRPVEYLCVFVR